jgi:hypothetical protein
MPVLMKPLNLNWTIALGCPPVDKSASHRGAGARLDGNDCASFTVHPMVGESPPTVRLRTLPSHASSPHYWPGYRLANVSSPTLRRSVNAGLA